MISRNACSLFAVSLPGWTLALQCAFAQAPADPIVASTDASVLIDVEMTEGTNMAAAVSPDGTTLILALQGVLWRVPVDGGVAMALTSPEMDAHEPVWSADGEHIAFYAFAEDGFSVWTMAPDGTELTRISTEEGDARYPSFSPGGDKLYYSSDSGGGYTVRSVSLGSGEYAQITNATDTGYLMPTTPYFSRLGNAVYPAMSPDGRTLAFVIDGDMDTLVIQMPGAGERYRVIHSASVLGAPLWAPDGTGLYITGISGAQGQLMRVAVDGSSSTLLASGDVFPFRPSLAPDGTLYYTAEGQVRTLAPDGTGGDAVPFSATVTLDRTPYTRRSYNFADATPRKALGIIDPALSPDGSRIAFAALGDLWLADPDKATTRRLTDDEYVDLSPSWSPDGTRIAFVSDRGGKTDVWVIDPVTGVTEQLTDSAVPVNAPAWSPDGREIAYLADALASVFLGATVNVLELGSGEVRTVSEPVFGPSAPAWSPDGTVLAIYHRMPMNSRFREGLNALYLLPASGQGETRWVSPVAGRSLGRRQFNRPAWSRDGDMVYRMDGALWAVPLRSDGTLGESRLLAATGENPAWSADGSSLVYLDGASIYLLDASTGTTRELDVQPRWQRDLPDIALTIRAGRLFDGTGEGYRENVDIVVEAGLITAIRPAGSAPVVGTLVDASTQVVLPGLIEGHAHQSTSQGIALGQLFLSHGITSVRETGGDPYYAVERREAEAAGRRQGPRVFTAGPLNEGARVSYGVSETVGTLERAADSLRLSTDLELDMYKSYVRQDYEVQRGVIAMAHESGIPLSSHELYPAVANGIDQMEHFGATSRRGYSLKISRLGHAYQDVISLITQSGLVVTPTLAMGTQNGQDISPQKSTLRRIVEGGGHIQAGTDSPFIPHAEALHRELAIYVDAGMSPASAIRTATSESAGYLGAGDQIGTIAPGFMADILIVDGDPLTEIADLRKVDTVIKSGRIVWRKSS